MRAWPLYIAAAAAVALALVLRGPREPSPTPQIFGHPPINSRASTFWTTPGLEPDTCVAAWLLTRVVSQGARIVIAESSTEGTPFDVPGTELGREPGQSVSDAIVRRHEVRDPFAVAVAAVARELELNPWTTNDEPFFSRVRGGLAEALNASKSDEECLRLTGEFLDSLRDSAPVPALGASNAAGSTAP